eukprot:2807396-Amphidinium_carterae.1
MEAIPVPARSRIEMLNTRWCCHVVLVKAAKVSKVKRPTEKKARGKQLSSQTSSKASYNGSRLVGM